jgi:hypothetical protein
VVEVWPRLPEAIRTTILTLVRSTPLESLSSERDSQPSQPSRNDATTGKAKV